MDGVCPSIIYSDIKYDLTSIKGFSQRGPSPYLSAYFKIGYNGIHIAPWNSKLGFVNISLSFITRTIKSYSIFGGIIPVINNLTMPYKVPEALFLRKECLSSDEPILTPVSFITSLDQERDLLYNLNTLLESSSLTAEEIKNVIESYAFGSTPFCLIVCYTRSKSIKEKLHWIVIRLWKINPDELLSILPINSTFSVCFLFFPYYRSLPLNH